LKVKAGKLQHEASWAQLLFGKSRQNHAAFSNLTWFMWLFPSLFMWLFPLCGFTVFFQAVLSAPRRKAF
jgi:hypothetical protein